MAKKKKGKAAARRKSLRRRTRETSISVRLNVDGRGRIEVKTGIGFFDHMLELLARHAAWDLKLIGRGDRQVDDHQGERNRRRGMVAAPLHDSEDRPDEDGREDHLGDDGGAQLAVTGRRTCNSLLARHGQDHQ